MIKIIYFLFILLINTNCSINKVVKHHGVHFLDKKHIKLKVSETNKNDARIILGPPSTTNTFDNDIWIYIERKTTVSEIKTLGRKKLLVNNVLILEFDNRGLLVKKDFYNRPSININNSYMSDGNAYLRQKGTNMSVNNVMIAESEINIKKLYNTNVMSK